MRRVKGNLCLLTIILSLNLSCRAQTASTTAAPGGSSGQPAPPAKQTPAASQSQADSLQTQIDKIKSDLQKQQDSDFGVTLGIGSLVLNPDVTDYSNQSNVLQANSLGSATPQYLIGISMRTRVPNFRHLGAREADCAVPSSAQAGASSGQSTNKKAAKASKSPPPAAAPAAPAAAPAATAPPAPAPPPAAEDNSAAQAPASLPPSCELWRRRPWEAFISLKFSPQSSQTLNGYVLGGSYAFAHYIDAMIGFALSPINEPAPGFRIAASNFVTQQQKSGLDLNFNPTSMLNNSRNAFDGFPLTDTTGKLIYTGNALEIDYRGGVVFGVSVPINFGALFSAKSP